MYRATSSCNRSLRLLFSFFTAKNFLVKCVSPKYLCVGGYVSLLCFFPPCFFFNQFPPWFPQRPKKSLRQMRVKSDGIFSRQSMCCFHTEKRINEVSNQSFTLRGGTSFIFLSDTFFFLSEILYIYFPLHILDPNLPRAHSLSFVGKLFPFRNLLSPWLFPD